MISLSYSGGLSDNGTPFFSPSQDDGDMVRLPLSLLLATALILAAAAVQSVAITDTSPLKFAVSLFAMGLGLLWLRATIKEWLAR